MFLDCFVLQEELLAINGFMHTDIFNNSTHIIPLTNSRYNMVGHLKFCITLTGGVLIFHDPVSLNQMIGVALTLLGIICYTHFKVQEQNRARDKARDKLGKPV